jgi:hypothetical protein
MFTTRLPAICPEFGADLPLCQPQRPRLFAKWEKVDGKLTCKWLRQPD